MSVVKDILQGKWLGHPLHPAVVHLPTALFPAALIFDVLALAGIGGSAMVNAAFWCIVGGLVVVLLAVPTGLADWWEIKPEKPAYKLGIYHMSLNGVVAVIFVVNMLIRMDDRTAGAPTWVQFTLSLIGTILLAVSGYIGGRMVYEHGVGVARMSKKKWRSVAEAGGARLP
jgi:uncharacterized membrane protein